MTFRPGTLNLLELYKEKEKKKQTMKKGIGKEALNQVTQ